MAKCMNGRHSCGMYLMFVVAIRPSNLLHELSSLCVVKNCSKSLCHERNAVTFTCHPEDSTIVDLNKRLCCIIRRLLVIDEVRNFVLRDLV